MPIKYLGLNLDFRLTWKTQIVKKQEIKAKLRSLFWLLRGSDCFQRRTNSHWTTRGYSTSQSFVQLGSIECWFGTVQPIPRFNATKTKISFFERWLKPHRTWLTTIFVETSKYQQSRKWFESCKGYIDTQIPILFNHRSAAQEVTDRSPADINRIIQEPIISSLMIVVWMRRSYHSVTYILGRQSKVNAVGDGSATGACIIESRSYLGIINSLWVVRIVEFIYYCQSFISQLLGPLFI